MALEQTVKIPENRRISLQVPADVPVGWARIVYFPEPADTENVKAGNAKVKPRLLSLIGIDKDKDTLEAYFKRHYADNEMEREIERREWAERGYGDIDETILP